MPACVHNQLLCRTSPNASRQRTTRTVHFEEVQRRTISGCAHSAVALLAFFPPGNLPPATDLINESGVTRPWNKPRGITCFLRECPLINCAIARHVAIGAKGVTRPDREKNGRASPCTGAYFNSVGACRGIIGYQLDRGSTAAITRNPYPARKFYQAGTGKDYCVGIWVL
jgi:hypothetical protein